MSLGSNPVGVSNSCVRPVHKELCFHLGPLVDCGLWDWSPD